MRIEARVKLRIKEEVNSGLYDRDDGTFCTI